MRWRRCSLKYGVLLAAGVSPFSPLAAGENESESRLLTGVEAGFGHVSAKAKADDEIDKDGTSASGGLYLIFPRDDWQYGLGLGIIQQSADGSVGSRGVKQTFKVVAPFVDARALYEITPGWLLGLDLRALNGKGAAFDPWNKDESGSMIYLGPRVEWYKDWSQTRFVVFAQGLQSLSGSDRQVLNIEAGIGFAFKLQSSPQPVTPEPVTPAPAAEPTPTPPPAEVAEAPQEVAPPQKITLNSKLVSFDLGSSQLRPESRAFLEKFAAILVQYQDAWKNLQISGHTDISGRKATNEKLSQGRADAVMQVFVQAGVPADRLGAKGYAAERLLPDLDPKAADHRRVELDFGELEGANAVEMQQSLNKLIEENQAKL
jgi:outer membrane protein OmpA-like peptidoglycan-associated protein